MNIGKLVIAKQMRSWVLLMAVLLASMPTAYAAPKSVKLTYEVLRNGQPFGQVTETYTQQGKQYNLQSVTKGSGVYALLGERKLLSQGDITKQGLRPRHFESLQSRSAKKTLINDFDWKSLTLNMQVKGQQEQTPLLTGTQDLLSVMYQFMFKPPQGEQIKLPVTTGKKLKVHIYRVNKQKEPVVTPAGSFKVVELVEADEADEADAKRIYLATDKYALPVKIVAQDDGATLEQLLTDMTIE